MRCVDRRPVRRACAGRGTVLARLVPWLLAAATAQAQNAPPPGSPTDVRYTPVQGDAPTLYPRSADDALPAVLRGEGATGLGVDFGANAAVGRLVVEVDRDAVPADG